jgi:hypothetical protein
MGPDGRAGMHGEETDGGGSDAERSIAGIPSKEGA